MDDFALEPPKDRAEAFTEAAARMGGVSSKIIEKDFWVTWTLKRLFSLSDLPAGLIFKGGTSLSKGYNAINRFSEDIDLSLDRHDLGFTGENDPASDGLSSNRRKALLKQMTAEAEAIIGGILKQKLHEEISRAINNPIALEVDGHDPQTLLFRYPESLSDTAYKSQNVKPQIRLEFGVRSDHLPAEQLSISPYLHVQIPELLENPAVEIRTLGAERTFWEKATILHWLFHRDADKSPRDRMSRHYYDLAQLVESPILEKALSDVSLLSRVRQHKSILFRSAEARYDTAKPGTLRLSPHKALEKALRLDYANMLEMIFDEPPSFDQILERITHLENRINEAPQ